MFKGLKDAFSNPLLEPVLLFHNASIQLFTQFNKLLQRSEPTVHVLPTSMLTLAKKIAHRIVKPEVLVSAKPTDVDLNDEEMFIEHQNIYLGGTTKAMLNKLLNEGDITETKYNKFFYAAHCYFKNSLAYILGKFQLREELIQNAVWINIPHRLEAEWQNVEYFYDRFDAIFQEIPVDPLLKNFVTTDHLLIVTLVGMLGRQQKWLMQWKVVLRYFIMVLTFFGGTLHT